MKRKNPINEALFVGPNDDHMLNPYARIIVDEARRRGIQADIIDAEGGCSGCPGAGAPCAAARVFLS